MPPPLLSSFAEVFLGTPSARAGAPGRPELAVRLADLAAGLPPDLRLRTARLDGRRLVEERRLREGDLLVAARGTRLHTAVVPAANAGTDVTKNVIVGAYATENLIVVRLEPSAPVLPEYLALLLEHGGVAEELAGLSSRPATGFRSLSPRELGEWRVPLVPLETQRELAAVLSATRRAIRAADEANRARRDVLRALARDVVRDHDEGDA